MVPVGKLRPNPYQPRESFEKELIEELAASIKSLDLLEPLIVRPVKGGFEIACGERRWRAAQMAKLDKVAAVVRDLDDRSLQLYSLVENLHRLDLTAPEREKAVYRLWRDYYKKQGKSQADLARDLGRSESFVQEHIQSYEERGSLDEETKEAVSTYDLRVTRGMEELVRKKLLKEKAAGRLPQKDFEVIAEAAKEAPPQRQRVIVEEAMKELREVRDIVREEARAFARGEMEARDIKVQLDADQRRLNRFLDVRNTIIFDWTVASVEMIENEKLRKKAVEYIGEVYDHCGKLLDQLKRRGWYAK